MYVRLDVAIFYVYMYYNSFYVSYSMVLQDLSNPYITYSLFVTVSRRSQLNLFVMKT